MKTCRDVSDIGVIFLRSFLFKAEKIVKNTLQFL